MNCRVSGRGLRRPGAIGFTLVELLVSMGLIVLLLFVLVSITDSTGRTWAYTTSKVEEFKDAREAFESITRKLSQATLNTYWDYEYPGGASNPDKTKPPQRYIRQSELRFICGNAVTLMGASNCETHAVFFQAPLGLVYDSSYSNAESLLNTLGYFVEFGDDSQWRPAFINAMPNAPVARSRFRLMELMEPSESLTLYGGPAGDRSRGTSGNPGYIGHDWFTYPLSLADRPVRVVAENIVALVLLPKLASEEDPAGTNLSPQYLYDSTREDNAQPPRSSDPRYNPKNQLPPIVQVTMVAVDEPSFGRFMQRTTTPTELYTNSPFTDATKYKDDLKALQDSLAARRINYRVFTTNVSIKGAKWSSEQAN